MLGLGAAVRGCEAQRVRSTGGGGIFAARGVRHMQTTCWVLDLVAAATLGAAQSFPGERCVGSIRKGGTPSRNQGQGLTSGWSRDTGKTSREGRSPETNAWAWWGSSRGGRPVARLHESGICRKPDLVQGERWVGSPSSPALSHASMGSIASSSSSSDSKGSALEEGAALFE